MNRILYILCIVFFVAACTKEELPEKRKSTQEKFEQNMYKFTIYADTAWADTIYRNF